MATQFLVRSPGNKHAISLKTILYDGVGLSRVDDNGMAVFELSDADVEVEIVVRRKNSSSGKQPDVTTTEASSHDVPLGEDATKHSLLVDAGSVLSREVQLEAVAKHSSLVQADMILPRDLQLRDSAKRPCEPTDELMGSSPKKPKSTPNETSQILNTTYQSSLLTTVPTLPSLPSTTVPKRRSGMSPTAIQQNYSHEPIELQTTDNNNIITCKCNPHHPFQLTGKSKYEIDRHFKGKQHQTYVSNPDQRQNFKGPMSDVTLLEVYQHHHPIEYDGTHVVCACNRYVLSGKGRYEIERHFKNRGHLAYVANPQGMTMNGTLSDTLLRQRYNHEPIEYREEEGGGGGVVVCVCNEFVLSGRNKYAIERHFEGKNHLDYVAKWRNENNTKNNNTIGVDNEDEEEGENDGVGGDNDNVAVVLENDAVHEEGENGNGDENVAVTHENDAGDGHAKEGEEEELELGQSNSGTDNAEAALEDDAVDIQQEEELGSRQSNNDGNNGDDTLENDCVDNKKEGESISRQAAI
eukprot:scaffold41436_cov37-Cyclotella_meneghiniana.AAC.1